MTRQPRRESREREDWASHLEDWLAAAHPPGTKVRIADISAPASGVSNETTFVELALVTPSGENRSDSLVLRTAPAQRGVLEPYDVARQYQVMRSLAGSSVPVPRMLGLEESGAVIGRPFFTMERLHGETYQPPDYTISASAEEKRRMTVHALEVMAAIHTLEWRDYGLDFLLDPVPWPEAEVGRWARRHRDLHAPIAALDTVLAWLRSHMPSTWDLALIHGDMKLPNFLWQSDQVVALLDWEMAGIGDPRMDLAYYLVVYKLHTDGHYVFAEGLSRQETIEHYSALTGRAVGDLGWYEVLNLYKLAVILALCGELFATGETDDLRYFSAGLGTARMIELASEAGEFDLPAEVDLPLPTNQRLAQASGTAIEELLVHGSTSASHVAQARAAMAALRVIARREASGQ